MPINKFLSVAIASLVLSVRLTAQCSSSVAVQVPLSACKLGAATVGVTPVRGASYAWTVDGGTITGDASADHINIALGTKDTATASVTMIAGTCTSRGSGVIALRGAFGVRPAIPEAHANEPLTITWIYDNGSPARQTISGPDIGNVTLAPGVRSYTYTPETSGSKQIVFDAAMQVAPDAAVPPARRRAVASSPAGASMCAESLHTMVPYAVGECVNPLVVIDAPASAGAGTVFQVSVAPQPNAIATWTITNGSPATAMGENVTITAGAAGAVGVSVRLTRGTCAAEMNRSVSITAKPVCSNPKATVTLGPVSCGSTTLTASFTGTPPFRGTWSDSVPFFTYGSVVREITTPGTYSILAFEDAICTGTASGAVEVPEVGKTAIVTSSAMSCAGDTMKVQFTGKPPFTGQWNDNTSFVTNEMQIEKVLFEGANAVKWVYDATDCYLRIVGSVNARPRPSIIVDQACLGPDFDNVVLISATFHTYAMPLTVTWSDSLTQSTSVGDPIWRTIQPLKETTTFTAVSAHDAYCTATLEKPSATVYASPIPDFHTGLGNICSGSTMALSLDTPPPAGAQIHWFAENGSIVSGEGTSSIQYKSGDIGVMMLGCTFTYAQSGRCATSHRQAMSVAGAPDATIALSKPEIHAGENAVISFTTNRSVSNWTLTDSQNDPMFMIGTCGAGSPCQYLYQSSKPGKSKITLHLIGFCPDTNDLSIDLNVLP